MNSIVEGKDVKDGKWDGEEGREKVNENEGKEKNCAKEGRDDVLTIEEVWYPTYGISKVHTNCLCNGVINSISIFLSTVGYAIKEAHGS